MVSKHLELAKRKARYRYERFASPSSHTDAPPSCQEVENSSHHCTTPPPSCQAVGSSSRRSTAPPPSRQEVGSSTCYCTAPPSTLQEEASCDESIVEMWVVAPPPTCLKLASSDDSSSGYNDECPHVKEVSSYELLLDFNCLV
jgi:hypothetical protein